jgi:hypothetical protein
MVSTPVAILLACVGYDENSLPRTLSTSCRCPAGFDPGESRFATNVTDSPINATLHLPERHTVDQRQVHRPLGDTTAQTR